MNRLAASGAGRHRPLRACAVAIALLLGLACVSAGAQALQPIPKFEARVTDLTGTLTAGEQRDLEQKLADFEARKGSQIAVLVVATTSPEEIEQYSIRVVDAWKPGRKKTDDGVLLLLAKDDHTVRIEVGYGLEGALTDITSKRIIEETMVPLLRQGQFSAAINAGVDQVIRVVDGEPLPPPDANWQQQHGRTLHNALPLLFVAFLAGSALLRSMFGRVLGAGLTGGLIGVVSWLLFSTVVVSLGAAAVAFLVALFMGVTGGTGGFRGGFGGLGGLGGGFGGGGLGGGGFGGGFGGGGGGGFGGGGASGRW
ncbi:MAG TPA: YgcG family protein [Steroidobacteraceae bacterium]